MMKMESFESDFVKMARNYGKWTQCVRHNVLVRHDVCVVETVTSMHLGNVPNVGVNT